VGGTDETRVNVRLISATNRDLETMSHDGTFREDLYFRLNVLSIQLPPLRDRREDIAAIAEHFIARAARQIERDTPKIARDALQWLIARDWPGNVRELENILFRAVALLDGPILGAHDLETAQGNERPRKHRGGIATQTSEPVNVDHITLDDNDGGRPAGFDAHPDILADALTQPDFTHAMDLLEKAYLEQLYPDYPSSRKLAARLGLSHTAVANKLRKYGIGAPNAT
jgi:TyrR family helix-turn-helix protein